MANSVYNILPVDNPLADHAALLFPEVQASIAALRTVGELRRPNGVRWTNDMDLLDWLGAWFGFQEGNVKNQREHLVLLLANAQMRLQPQATNRVGFVLPPYFSMQLGIVLEFKSSSAYLL
jgi:callose synthase